MCIRDSLLGVELEVAWGLGEVHRVKRVLVLLPLLALVSSLPFPWGLILRGFAIIDHLACESFFEATGCLLDPASLKVVGQ